MNYRPNRQRALELLENNRAIRNRTVTIIGHIENCGEWLIRTAIERAARDCEEIKLLIDSPGGSVRVANRIEDDLRQTRLPIDCRVGNQCSSAAIGPMLAAHRRSAPATATFHLHPTGLNLEGKPLAHVTADELRFMASDLEASDRQYRTQLAALSLPTQILKRARSSAGVRLGGHEAYVYGLLTHLSHHLTD